MFSCAPPIHIIAPKTFGDTSRRRVGRQAEEVSAAAMDWSDDAIVLSARKHGESAAIAQLLTRGHGRHAGLVRGGAATRLRGVLQPGNELHCVWRARLEEHLGAYTVELARARAAALLDRRLPLLALSAACAVVETMLPEREPHGPLFDGLIALLDALEESEAWPAAYVRWEVGLLRELGFGLDLSACAATGVTEGLVWVSPKTGRAVSAEAGEPYRDRLLSLPGFLVGEGAAAPGDIVAGLRLTGHFLGEHGAALPAARDRLVDGLSRSATTSCGNKGS